MGSSPQATVTDPSSAGSALREDASLPELGPLRRLGWLALAWTLYVASGPGVLHPDGSAIGAGLGVLLWASSAARPGRRAYWVEAFVAMLAWSWIVQWSAYVFWFCVVWMGVGLGLWQAAAGALLRRLARGRSLAFAVPVAWVSLETLRTVTPTPIGLSWMRLGTHLHATPLVESARLWGAGGLSIVIAALAGLGAELVRRRRVERAAEPAPELAAVRLRTTLAWGLAPLLVALAAPHLISLPEMQDGPRVMCVQPAIPQARKQRSGDPLELLRDSLILTRKGLLEARAAGEPEPDCVLWGETMLFTSVIEDGLVEKLEVGLEVPPWRSWVDAESMRVRVANEEFALQQFFAEPRGILPEGTSLVCGADIWLARPTRHGERLGRQNAIVVWNSAGQRLGWGGKRELVPGAETLLGLENWDFARDVIYKIAGYVPDHMAPEATAVFPLETRDGRSFRFSTTVCFDNAYDYPYTEPLRAARHAEVKAEDGQVGDSRVDFHVVGSNEAWFLESLELDQMVAFSRITAAATARSIVRATNSGVSCVIGPDGRDVARLVVAGRDRLVPGTLRATVPVPAPAGRPRAVFLTPFVRWQHSWSALWILAPLLALGLARRPRARRAGVHPPETL